MIHEVNKCKAVNLGQYEMENNEQVIFRDSVMEIGK
jgi:hypothetical protein